MLTSSRSKDKLPWTTSQRASSGTRSRWGKLGRTVSVPLPNQRIISAPISLVLILLVGLVYLGLLHRSTSHKASGLTSSSFLVPSNRFLPPTPHPPNPAHFPEPIAPKQNGMLVPNALHYVYGLKPIAEGALAEELPYYAYLAIRSAMINLRPAKIYFHYEHLPRGPWWDLLVPDLALIKTVVPNSYLGKEIKHFAHKADVLRLMAMKYSGGVYLDIDMFVVKPFDDLFWFPTTLGMQASPHSEATALEPQGLCNAVIIAQPHSSFIDRWLASYETFEDGQWDEHSVNMPWKLARRYPDEIQVLSNKAFFWPMWHGNEIEKTHELDEHDFKGSGQYAYHAWESLAMKFLHNLSPASIREEDNSFNKMVRPFIGIHDDATYAQWKGKA